MAWSNDDMLAAELADVREAARLKREKPATVDGALLERLRAACGGGHADRFDVENHLACVAATVTTLRDRHPQPRHL